MENSNPDALSVAQDDEESFEVMKKPPEGFDMYHDRPISAGYNKARKLVHKDAEWHRSVHIWIVDPESRQLVLQKRSPNKDTFPNRWDISAAGHIESGGESRDTAVRELSEELGISTQAESLLFAFTCPAEQAPLGGCNCYEDVYVLPLKKSECHFSVGEAEVTGIKWVGISEMKDYWENEDQEYVPRVGQYRDAFFKKLNAILEYLPEVEQLPTSA